MFSYFKRTYEEAQAVGDEASWDNGFRNIYNAVKNDRKLLEDMLSIPERTRIVRTDRKEPVSIAFAKRGHEIAGADDQEARIVSAQDVLEYFKAETDEESSPGDEELDAKFAILRNRIMKRHTMPNIEGNRAKAQKVIQYLRDNCRAERDYLADLIDVIHRYDDLSDGELKFLAQLNLGDVQAAVERIKQTLTPHYIGVIKERAEAIGRVTETIIFAEDLRT